jgi:hypothetical protein
MKYKIAFLIFSFLYLNNNISAQSPDPESCILLERNIISYHIRNAVEGDIPIGSNGILIPHEKPIFQQLMPANGKLRMIIKPYNGKIQYPSIGYQMFTVQLRGFKYDLVDGTSYSVNMLGFLFDENYLVAYNPKNSSIKYISGNFFKSRAAEDFKLDRENLSSFNNYLMLRCYYMLPDTISYNRKDASGIYFMVHSKIVETAIEVFISYDDYEVVRIIDKIK